MQLAVNCTLVVCRRIVGCSFCLKPAAMSRLKNTATLDDVRKCIRSELSSVDVSKLETDNEAVAGNHMSFLLALMKLTLRPGGPMLRQQHRKLFPRAVLQIAEFSGRPFAILCRTVETRRSRCLQE